ncbi:MAG TPA: 2-hydroxyacid dehydrogenase [Steroidobacteraceae bacterium]|nr:2-hydroxyacid dehydrogenase [Steroidobacteraceae bacterium]
MKAVFLDWATVSRGDLDLDALREVLPALELFDDSTAEQTRDRIAGAEVVIANKIRLDAELIRSARDLKLIALVATGTNNVDLAAARERNIAVCNVRAYCTQSVVQHVFGVLLALTHRFADYQQLLRAGEWTRSPQFCLLAYPIRELAGLELGIVGYGELGRAVARVAEAFGMAVLVANRPGGAREAQRYDLEDLLRRVDVLSLHCPLTEHTQGLIGARELGLMKRDAVLINTARGALVDTAALADALRAGTIGGAAIDVLAQEPPIDGSPLLDPDIPNLILTPHIAWAAREARQRALDQLAENVASFLAGGTLRRVD